MSQLEILFKRNMVDFVNEIQSICCPNEPRIFIVKQLLENIITPDRCMADFETYIYIYKHMITDRDIGILSDRAIWDKFHPYVGDMILAFDVTHLDEENLECLWNWMDNFCKFIEYRHRQNSTTSLKSNGELTI